MKMFRPIIAVLAVALLCVSPARGQSTKAQINTLINTNLPDNVIGAITPSIMRSTLATIPNSTMPTAPVVPNNLSCYDGTTGLLKDCGSPIGASGATVPLNNGNNTLSGTNTFTGNAFFGSGRPWVDVRSGANGCAAAIGNGSNDDQAAIECQINYMNTTFLGGVVYFPPGNYHVGSTLAIAHGVHLVCAGWVSTSISANTDITVLSFGVSSQITAGVHGCAITGDQNQTATQNLVVIANSSLVDFDDSYLSGGNWAVQQGGDDGHWKNVQIFGVGSSGGGILSTGANWYDHVKIDQGSVATLAAFEQSTSATVLENHFTNSDFSGSYIDSIIINDGGNGTAITGFVNSVFSSPIVITSAKNTSFATSEIGSTTFTFNSGSLNLVGNFGLAALSVTGSATNVNCKGNINITCADKFTNSISGNVNLTNTGYVDGPSVAQGTAGNWFASGSVLITATSGHNIICKLWDGTTLIASTGMVLGQIEVPISLSGYISSPAGNIKISCENVSAASGTITASNGVDTKASTVTAIRVD